MSERGCMSEDPRALLERVTVLGNEEIAEGVWLLTLQAPRVAADVEPGQFVHLRISEGASFILRRPFSVHRAYGERIELLYQVLGTGTRAMSAKDCGDVMDIIGPLGTGWCVPDDAGEVLLVGGGLGAAPLGMLAEDLRARGIGSVAALGAPTAARLVGREIFESAADLVELATDDGSEGESGFVTVVSDRLLAQRALGMVCVCGPEAMARTVAEQSQAGGVPCRVSLERLMACGVGACLSCVVRTTTGHKRACVEGPVFDAADIVWGAEYTLKH